MATSASTPRRGRKVNAVQALGLLTAFALVAGVGGLLGAGLVLPAVASTSAVANKTTQIFNELPAELSQVPLSEKSTILAADGTVLATFYDQNRIVVPLSEISVNMINAVIDTEDRRFFEHGGVDLTGMTRALLTNALSSRKEGASTLTQQYVKNAQIQAALQIDDPVKQAQAIAAARADTGLAGYARKLEEAKLAISLEKVMTKDQILQAYLNISQFGVSIYGVETAAQYYFSVSAKDLNYLQAATIAGITNAPTDYDPQRNPEKSQARRDTVLSLMLKQGDITRAEYDTGIATPIADTLKIGQTSLGCATAGKVVAGSGYFCDYVTKVIAQDPAFGKTPADRRRLLYQGGLTIHTTLDPRMQELADAAVKGAIPIDDPSGIADAMSTVEPGTGKILAMAQNRTFSTAPNPGPGLTSLNYNADYLYGGSGGFAPGSTYKAFTLLEWFKEGHSLQEVVDGRVKPYQFSQFNAPCTGLGNGTWKPGNSEGTGNLMTVADATRNSVNNAFAEMATQLNLCSIFQGAQDLGVHTAQGAPPKVVPSNILGTDSVAPLTMAAAYAAFAADGNFCEPIAITAVEDSNGKELKVPSANCRQAITPQLAHAMSYGLSKVWQGTARNVRVLPDGRPASGKTGTTSANEDTWFVGYTAQLSTAVWVGHSEGFIPMHSLTINGTFYQYVYGSSVAAPAWRAFMAPASQGMPVVAFPPADSAQVVGVQVTVPDVVGMSESTATAVLDKAGFNVKTGSAEYSSSAPVGSVASTTPAGGSRAVRGTVVTLVLSLGVDPATIKPPPPPPTPTPLPTKTNNGKSGG